MRKNINYLRPPPPPEKHVSLFTKSVNCGCALLTYGGIALAIGLGLLVISGQAPEVMANFDKFIEGNGATGVAQREFIIPWLCKVTQGLMCK